ncbi:MAG: NADH-quinone oxidoreductase subunit H [Candidatus Didemnitutus sp.]|nr:NADH-quinone oxidoreductase subunit H [Candidatus Didemnitutus sp.]
MMAGMLLPVALLGLATGIVTGPRWPRAWLALMLTGSVAALFASVAVLAGGGEWEWRSSFPLAGETLHLRLDGLSAFFLALLAVVGGTGSAYAHGYWGDAAARTTAPRGRMWWSGLVLSLALVLVLSNGLHFLIAWELFALSAFFLIILDKHRPDVRAAGWLYLAASHAGTLALFAFFALLAARTGSWELGPMREAANATELAPLYWLALAGFGLKAGLFPLHIWLPSAHASAPSHVSALLSGVALKVGIYGLVRFSGWLPVPASAGWVIVGLGAASALFGVAFAFAQNDCKRLLAYCSVENVGIILVGFGFALVAREQGEAVWGQLVLAGALLHVWNHGLFKALLFFGAGSVLHATGTREMSRLGGLWRRMPWTAGLFALGAVAIAGLPPLNGFVSEWLIYLGLFETATSRVPAAAAALPAVILLAVSGALALGTFVKAGALIFHGAPRSDAARDAHESGPWMLGPMLVLAGACAAFALAPGALWTALARASAAWRPEWGAALAPVPLFTLGAVNAALAALFVVAAAWLWRRARANGLRRALTWDCGYAAPTARMQYSGGSFAGIATGWFFWILRPERKTRRPRGPLPDGARRIERVPETVLEHVIGPMGGAILRVSTAVRRLQHGHLQSYILYLLGGLVALAGLVLMGGPR